MSFTLFAARLFFVITTFIMSCYLYTIYCALSQTMVMTLSTGKRYLVHPDLLVSSGAGRGGIGKSIGSGSCSLINSEHASTDSFVSFEDSDLVVGVVLADGSTCAYSRSLLLWHQVINERFGENSILVTLCPFTDTVTCFAASLHGDAMRFGVSGMLYLGSLVMYDQATNSCWSCFDCRAIVGPMSGCRLEQLPVMVVTWKEWRSLYPESAVVSGCDDSTSYTFDPYCKLYMHTEHNLYGTLFSDHRLLAEIPIAGVALGDVSVAYGVEKICAAGFVQDNINGVPVLVTACGLSFNAETCPIAVFDCRVKRTTLYFVYKNGHVEDTESHSLWNYQGSCYQGPLIGTKLKRLPIVSTTWFSWSLFYPKTRIY